MRQQQHDAVLSDPLGLTGTDELVDDALGRVVEVSKLSLPQDQSVGTRHRETQLEACTRAEGFTVNQRTADLQTTYRRRGGVSGLTQDSVLGQRAVADGVRRLVR